jgi:MtN3 and saliva related transmembrane protein
MTTLLGLTAGVLTTSCWAPQLLRSYRTRSTADISWLYLGALGAGIVLWLTYGVVSRDAALVATNIATSLAIGVLALLKYRFDRLSRRRDDERVELLGSRRAA